MLGKHHSIYIIPTTQELKVCIVTMTIAESKNRSLLLPSNELLSPVIKLTYFGCQLRLYATARTAGPLIIQAYRDRSNFICLLEKQPLEKQGINTPIFVPENNQ